MKKKPSSKVELQRHVCSRCQEYGHNARTCPNPVRGVRDRISHGAKTANPKVRVAQASAHDAPRNGAQEALAQESSSGSSARAGISIATFEEAVAVITESESRGEGFRHLQLGDTGAGKTTVIRKLLDHRPAESLALIHDVSKAVVQYRGQVVLSLDAAAETATEVVFHGDVYSDVSVSVDYVAGEALTLARAHVPVWLVVDELDEACTVGGRALISPKLGDCNSKGRSMLLSCIESTQSPHRVPAEIINPASSVGLNRLSQRALNYLDERLLFDAEMLAVVPTLQVTKEYVEFVLHRNGYAWDRKIYRCPFPPRLRARPRPAPVEATTTEPEEETLS